MDNTNQDNRNQNDIYKNEANTIETNSNSTNQNDADQNSENQNDTGFSQQAPGNGNRDSRPDQQGNPYGNGGNGQNSWQNNQNNWSQWRNPNHQPSDNNPYYNQPTSSPYRRQAFATASMVCGILAMLTSCTGIFSVPFACLGILFAVLAYRKGRRSSQIVVTGIALSCVGLVSGIFMLVSSLMMLPQMLRDPNYRAQLDTMTQQLYGTSFTDLLEKGYGFDLDAYLENTK